MQLKSINYGKCLSFLKPQVRPVGQRGAVQDSIRPAITISRIAGTGGYKVAAKLAEYLQTHVPGRCEWREVDYATGLSDAVCGTANGL
jgi:hypothetical protein